MTQLGPRPSGAWAAPAHHRVVLLEEGVFGDVQRGRIPADLERLRTEAYRLASTHWEDRWAYGRVAAAEELSAEWARQEGRWQDAWGAWRASWWIRYTLKDTNDGQRDLVMGALHLRVGRFDDAATRLGEAEAVLDSPRREVALGLLHAVASGDRF